MKKLKPQISILFLILVFVFSCSKDSENQPPTGEITSPQTGAEFFKGDNILISVDANDSDGSIKEIKFYIDGIGKYSTITFPYNFDWETEDVETGTHSIKVYAIDNDNLQAESEIDIVVKSNEGEFVDARDNTTYKWIKIGNQIWMAENLAYLPKINSYLDVSSSNSRYYVYGYDGTNVSEAKDLTNYKKYGVLYNLSAAQESCPDGWHLPTLDEWDELCEFISNDNGGYEKDHYGDWTNGGQHLKSKHNWSYYTNNEYHDGSGIDSYDFNALPGGFIEDEHDLIQDNNIDNSGRWWSSSFVDNDYWGFSLNAEDDNMAVYDFSTLNGLSVRCIKDNN